MAEFNITTKRGRSKLPQRREPYWRQLTQGRHIGFRKTSGGGTWVAKFTHPGRKRDYKSLGPDLSYDEAAKSAEGFFRVVGGGGDARYSVGQALTDYTKYLGAHNGPGSAQRTKAQFAKHVHPRLRNATVATVTTPQLALWHWDMVRESDDADAVRASKDSANRVLSQLKAALNFAWHSGQVADDNAWRRVKPFKGVTESRKLFLSPEEVQALLGAAEGGFRNLCEAAVLTGGRYGELATAKVSDFDATEGTLHLDGKTGPRLCYLSDKAVATLKRVSSDRLPAAHLFVKDDGSPWGTSHQHRPMREAVRQAKLPRDTVFYSLRHYHISKALEAGVPAQAIAENCGTSVVMIERHYGKFTATARHGMMNRVPLL